MKKPSPSLSYVRVRTVYKEQDSINHPIMVPDVLLFPRGGLEVAFSSIGLRLPPVRGSVRQPRVLQVKITESVRSSRSMGLAVKRRSRLVLGWAGI
jgi:hypothetical protein